VIRLDSQRHVAATLRRLRYEAGYTVPAFARRLGISASLGYYRDRGERPISVDALIDAADLLGYELVLKPRQGATRRAA
jgi:transcriptional regulator with XRE-family HTH domain